MQQDKRKVLVVGAGGFVGGFIVEEALRRGYDVTAGLRHSTSRKYLGNPAIKFLEMDFDNPSGLAETLRAALPEGERWDWIVYNLGATKCLNFTDFNRINYIYLKEFTSALHQADIVPEKMLYMSSLSAMGKGRRDYTPFSEDMIPAPDTRYGASKLKAEMWLATCGIPTVIFRATGIYGPRDHDYFLMFDSIEKGFDFSVGFRKQLLTFLYVEDLASAIFDALVKASAGETYIVAHPHAYTQKEFRAIAANELKKKFVMPVCFPLAAVKAVCSIAEKIGVARGKPSTLNSDKFKILAQRNWTVCIDKARNDFGFKPATDLKEGVQKTVEWYKKEGWL